MESLFELALNLKDWPVVHSVLGALFIATAFTWVSFFKRVFILFGRTVDTTLQLTLPAVFGGVTFLRGVYAPGLRADNMTRK